MKYETNKVCLIKGQSEQFFITMVDENAQIIGLNGLTTLTMRLLKQDSSVLEKNPISGQAAGYGTPLNIFIFELTADEINSLQVKADQDVQLKMTFGSVNKFHVIPKCLTVKALPY